MSNVTQNTLTDNTLGRNAEEVLPFSSAAEESKQFAPERQAISESYRVVMAVLAQANAPDGVRNYIDALINLSKGEGRIEAADYLVGAAFYTDEDNRNRLKKKVQSWRRSLTKWQTESGYTLVQIRSGYKISETKNQPSLYRLVVLELAAKVLAKGDTDIESAARAVLREACGIPPKVDDVRRRNKHTPDSCRRMGLSWIDKSLGMARAEGHLGEALSEVFQSLAILLDEYEREVAGEPKSAHLEGQGEPNLGSISTTSNIFSHDEKIDVVGKSSRPASVCGNESFVSKIITGDNITAESVPVSKVSYALDLARRGFRVFPVHCVRANGCSCKLGAGCPTPAKHPRVMRWQEVATTEEKQIREWWRQSPSANIGVATGKASGIVVIDVDTKSDGYASLLSLESEHGALPKTLTARTGSGGLHILFKYPDGAEIKNLQASKKLGSGLDVRGKGGFVVAAGSIHASGNRYEWVDADAKIEEMPAWLVEKLTAPAPVQVAAKRETPSVRTAQAQGTGKFPTIYESGEIGRNNFLFIKAAGLVRSNTYDDALSRVSWWNERCCVPPVEPAELEKLVRSAHARYGKEYRLLRTQRSRQAQNGVWQSR